ncbi:hypothetical protein H310_01459 [Aphanomyces invadans]|uniref:Uncharacterized protein n=1 Tax=Aphanomyces invadans TaxID=157072 RepID=A0A024URC5_9STRA|nr:hypothetical protein H310_01459 [Aphanomyces invadans]ETW08981.1 hypothetical protein H310_01459 [Aphanomyces invadans]|eukprot:XP_008862786.1 hypothetical protein H310_01459 [Aphanomyces invadans]
MNVMSSRWGRIASSASSCVAFRNPSRRVLNESDEPVAPTTIRAKMGQLCNFLNTRISSLCSTAARLARVDCRDVPTRMCASQWAAYRTSSWRQRPLRRPHSAKNTLPSS